MANLKNDYKIMYEARTHEEGELIRNLKATKSLPAATDENVVYKDAEGAEIDPKNFKLIFEKEGQLYGTTIPLDVESGIKFNVYCNNTIIL